MPHLDLCVLAAHQRVAHLQSQRRDDVPLFAVSVGQQRDSYPVSLDDQRRLRFVSLAQADVGYSGAGQM